MVYTVEAQKPSVTRVFHWKNHKVWSSYMLEAHHCRKNKYILETLGTLNNLTGMMQITYYDQTYFWSDKISEHSHKWQDLTCKITWFATAFAILRNSFFMTDLWSKAAGLLCFLVLVVASNTDWSLPTGWMVTVFLFAKPDT